MVNYKCSIHGNVGDPNCKECRENLRKLCQSKNAHLIEEDGGYRSKE